MTLWSTRVEEAAGKIAASSVGRADETVETYVIHGNVDSSAELGEWLRFRDDVPTGFSLQIRDEFNESLLASHEGHEYPLAIRVRIEKPAGEVAYFFSGAGLERSIDDPSLPTYSIIRVAGQFSEFASRLCAITVWNSSELSAIASDDESRVDARRLVRDATGTTLPSSLEFWILHRRPIVSSKIFEIWSAQATRALLPSLAAEIWPAGDEPEIVLSGSRKCKLKLGLGTLRPSIAFEDVNDALTWVCESTREAEIRHTLLIKRLATEWPPSDPSLGEGVAGVLKSALDGARSDYKAHLLQSTSETLKALSDLRKALNDEVNKVVERTQALSSTLFRDIAVALGAVAFRLVGIADGKSAAVGVAFLGIVAIWLVASLVITLMFNREALRTQAKTRASWHRRVHGALAKRDFDSLARKPLKAAIKSYTRSATLVAITYGVIAMMLGVWFAVEVGCLL